MDDRVGYETLLKKYLNAQKKKAQAFEGGNFENVSPTQSEMTHVEDMEDNFTDLIGHLQTERKFHASERVRDALTAMPEEVLKLAMTSDYSYSFPSSAKQIEVLLFWSLKYLIDKANYNNEGIQLFYEDLLSRDYGDINTSIFVIDDSSNTFRSENVDCNSIFLDYLNLNPIKAAGTGGISKLIKLLSNLGKSIISALSSPHQLTTDTASEIFRNLDSQIDQSDNKNFKNGCLELMKTLFSARQKWQKDKYDRKRLDLLSFEFMTTLGVICQHVIMLDEIQKNISKLCKNASSIIQHIDNPVKKVNMRSSDGKVVCKIIYFLVTIKAATPILFRVIALNIKNQLCVIPFSGHETPEQNINNIKLFEQKIKPYLRSTPAYQNSTTRKTSLFELDSVTESKAIMTDLHNKIPYLDLFSIIRDKLLTSKALIFDKQPDEVHGKFLKITDDYFNYYFILCVSHFVKNAIMNATTKSLTESIEDTIMTLENLDCTCDSDLASVSQQIERILFQTASPELVFAPSEKSGMTIKQVQANDQNKSRLVYDHLKQANYFNFMRLYRLLSRTMLFTSNQISMKSGSSSSVKADPMFDFVKNGSSRIAELDKIIRSASKEEIIRKCLTVLNVENSSPASPINTSTSNTLPFSPFRASFVSKLDQYKNYR